MTTKHAAPAVGEGEAGNQEPQTETASAQADTVDALPQLEAGHEWVKQDKVKGDHAVTATKETQTVAGVTWVKCKVK